MGRNNNSHRKQGVSLRYTKKPFYSEDLSEDLSEDYLERAHALAMKDYILSNIDPAPPAFQTKLNRYTLCENCVDKFNLAHMVVMSLLWFLSPSMLNRNTFCEVEHGRCEICHIPYPPKHTLKDQRKQVRKTRNCGPILNWKRQIEKVLKTTLCVCVRCKSVCMSKLSPSQTRNTYYYGLTKKQKEQYTYVLLLNSRNPDKTIKHLVEAIPEVVIPLIREYEFPSMRIFSPRS